MTELSRLHSDLAFADISRKALDIMRRQVDADEYKHVVLRLPFLKYISEAFETRREALKKELEEPHSKVNQFEASLEIPDEYTAERAFWVPIESRSTVIQCQAVRASIATLIDDGILAIEYDNTGKLKGISGFAPRTSPPATIAQITRSISPSHTSCSEVRRRFHASRKTAD